MTIFGRITTICAKNKTSLKCTKMDGEGEVLKTFTDSHNASSIYATTSKCNKNRLILFKVSQVNSQ